MCDTFLCVTFDLKNISFIWGSGLIDEGENAEITALRELKEETGFKGEVVGVTPGITGNTNTSCVIALTSNLCLISCVSWMVLGTLQ